MTATPNYQMPSHFLGGLGNGLSGQSNQQNASHPYAAQLGNAAGGINNAGMQQLLQQAQIHFLTLFAGAEDQSRVEPLKTKSIKLGEIVGWRGWNVSKHGFLQSMTAGVVWAPGEPMEGKTKTAEGGDCGIYAYKTARDFLTNLSSLDVYGRVALWGDIIEHELGYRAQFAKVISLERFLNPRLRFRVSIKQLRRAYCPEVA